MTRPTSSVDDSGLTPTGASTENGLDDEVEKNILRATERLLADVSLHQLSVQSVLHEAGTSRATFYRRFNSKWSVVAAALEVAAGELFAAAQPFFAPRPGMPPLERLEQVTVACGSVFRKHRNCMRAAMEYWPSMPELEEPWLRMMENLAFATAGMIEQQRAEGLASSGPPALDIGRALVWSATHCYLSAARWLDDEEEPEAKVAPALAHLWAGAIYGRMPA